METAQRPDRPTRKTAGKRAVNPDYVNSTEVIQDAIGDMIDENKEIMNGGRSKGRKRKRARSPSPLPPPLSPVEVLNEAHFTPMEESPMPETMEVSHFEPINLTFNIPLGFQGPLKVELDPSNFVRRPTAPVPQRTQYVVEPPVKRRKLEQGSQNGARSKKMAKWVKKYGKPPRGFLDLPAELRNDIYRMVFVSKQPIDFGNPINCQRSSALLTTCKQVHEEGTSILYSENRFVFRRNRNTRAPFWVSDSKEIGYLDMRHFLTMVGETGRGFLRRIHIILEDATKTQAAQLESDGRFTHDGNLLACFKVIARDCFLKTMAMTFQGRRYLSTFDVRFLEALSAIEVDNVVFNPGAAWTGDKFDARVRDILQKEMIRPDLLYEKDQLPKTENKCKWECYRHW